MKRLSLWLVIFVSTAYATKIPLEQQIAISTALCDAWLDDIQRYRRGLLAPKEAEVSTEEIALIEKIATAQAQLDRFLKQPIPQRKWFTADGFYRNAINTHAQRKNILEQEIIKARIAASLTQ